MYVLTASQMREWDRLSTEQHGVPGELLMEEAGAAAARLAAAWLRQSGKTRVTAVCGKGNNGGDGLVAARHLKQAGFETSVWLLTRPEELKGDTLANYQRLEGVVPVLAPEFAQLAVLEKSDLIIDGIYGTGLAGNIQGPLAEIIRRINELQIPVLSLDVPSGTDATTGQVSDITIQAEWTVTFGELKSGLLFYPARAFAGQVYRAPLSLAPLARAVMDIFQHALSAPEAAALLPVPDPRAHKYTAGKLLVLAGSRQYPGAAQLVCRAAQRLGASYVTLLVPESVREIMHIRLPEVIVRGLPESGENLEAEDARELVAPLLASHNALAVGPGLGLSSGAQELAAWAIQTAAIPQIIDADGLAALPSILGRVARKPHLLTPHTGEIYRLLGWEVTEEGPQRVSRLKNLTREKGLNILLKGPTTLNCNRGGDVYLNPTGNPGLAKAGTGDVLTGLAGALAARGLAEDHWGPLAAFLHGLAADQAARDLGELSLTAGDVIEYLPRTLQKLKRGEIDVPGSV